LICIEKDENSKGAEHLALLKLSKDHCRAKQKESTKKDRREIDDYIWEEKEKMMTKEE
jgi:hypothetical protein